MSVYQRLEFANLDLVLQVVIFVVGKVCLRMAAFVSYVLRERGEMIEMDEAAAW
jgi:hypothetical protein